MNISNQFQKPQLSAGDQRKPLLNNLLFRTLPLHQQHQHQQQCLPSFNNQNICDLTSTFSSRHVVEEEKLLTECKGTLKNQQYLPITCNGVSALLNVNRLGSGGKGKCIEYNEELLTPNEFQARCGKASSKDWKRSIRYHGRPISRLIDQKIIACHAISCICAACSDDASVQSPVRYFKKWNRKRRAPAIVVANNDDEAKRKISNRPNSSRDLNCSTASYNNDKIKSSYQMASIEESINKKTLISNASPVEESGNPLNNSNESDRTSQDDRSERMKNFSFELNSLSQLHNDIVNDIVNEQKCWWHLESVAENILRDAITLKAMIFHTKETSMNSKASILVQLRNTLSANSAQQDISLIPNYPHNQVDLLTNPTNIDSNDNPSKINKSIKLESYKPHEYAISPSNSTSMNSNIQSCMGKQSEKRSLNDNFLINKVLNRQNKIQTLTAAGSAYNSDDVNQKKNISNPFKNILSSLMNVESNNDQSILTSKDNMLNVKSIDYSVNRMIMSKDDKSNQGLTKHQLNESEVHSSNNSKNNHHDDDETSISFLGPSSIYKSLKISENDRKIVNNFSSSNLKIASPNEPKTDHHHNNFVAFNDIISSSNGQLLNNSYNQLANCRQIDNHKLKCSSDYSTNANNKDFFRPCTNYDDCNNDDEINVDAELTKDDLSNEGVSSNSSVVDISLMSPKDKETKEEDNVDVKES